MAKIYEIAYKNYFWQWEDNGEAVAIPEGGTIAMKAQLQGIIPYLAPGGLPPFGSLLLTLAALNPNGEVLVKQTLNRVRLFNPELDGSSVLTEVEQFLNRLIALPEAYKQGDLKKALLVAIFNRCHNHIAIKRSVAIAASVQRKFFPSKTVEIGNKQVLTKELQTISLLFKWYPDENRIEQAIAKIDLDEIKLKVDVTIEHEEDKVGEENEDLVEALITNTKTHKIGKLVKTLWAGLKLPMHATVRGDQPIGGVSDLTNKGNFDQLLISEYANDDLVFLSRLANNEALYIQRESPPSHNKRKRVILIDVSLKNWGRTKLFEFAVMVAITHHPQSIYDAEVFLIGDQFVEIDHKSVIGIIKALQNVEAVLDAGNGLKHYFKAFPPDPNREVFLISEQSTGQYSGFAYAINQFSDGIAYQIKLTNNGEVDLYKNGVSGLRHLQNIILPYETLWEKNTQSQQNKQKSETQSPRGYSKELMLLPAGNMKGKRIGNFGYGVITAGGEVFVGGEANLDNEKALYCICKLNLEVLEMKHYAFGYTDNNGLIMIHYDPKHNQLAMLDVFTGNIIQKTQIKVFNTTRSYIFIFANNRFYWELDHFIYEWEIGKDYLKSNMSFSQFREFEKSSSPNFKIKGIDKLNILRKIYNVGINSNNELVINNFALCFSSETLQWNTNKAAISVNAKWDNSDSFVFPNGNKVEVIKSGMIRLQDTTGKYVDIPTALNYDLGIAHNNYFAGNPSYCPQKLYLIGFLKKEGKNNVLKKVMVLKEILECSLNDANKVVESGGFFPKVFTLEQVKKAEKNLKPYFGNNMLVKRFTKHIESEAEIMSLKEFKIQFVEPFITDAQAK